jgi:Trk-type K+ transport system membrane component
MESVSQSVSQTVSQSVIYLFIYLFIYLVCLLRQETCLPDIEPVASYFNV